MEVPIVTRWINKEEWWPVYELHRDDDGFATAVHLPEDLVHRYAKAYAEFRAVQKILSELYGEED